MIASRNRSEYERLAVPKISHDDERGCSSRPFRKLSLDSSSSLYRSSGGRFQALRAVFEESSGETVSGDGGGGAVIRDFPPYSVLKGTTNDYSSPAPPWTYAGRLQRRRNNGGSMSDDAGSHPQQGNNSHLAFQSISEPKSYLRPRVENCQAKVREDKKNQEMVLQKCMVSSPVQLDAFNRVVEGGVIHGGVKDSDSSNSFALSFEKRCSPSPEPEVTKTVVSRETKSPVSPSPFVQNYSGDHRGPNGYGGLSYQEQYTSSPSLLNDDHSKNTTPAAAAFLISGSSAPTPAASHRQRSPQLLGSTIRSEPYQLRSSAENSSFSSSRRDSRSMGSTDSQQRYKSEERSCSVATDRPPLAITYLPHLGCYDQHSLSKMTPHLNRVALPKHAPSSSEPVLLKQLYHYSQYHIPPAPPHKPSATPLFLCCHLNAQTNEESRTLPRRRNKMHGGSKKFARGKGFGLSREDEEMLLQSLGRNGFAFDESTSRMSPQHEQHLEQPSSFLCLPAFSRSSKPSLSSRTSSKPSPARDRQSPSGGTRSLSSNGQASPSWGMMSPVHSPDVSVELDTTVSDKLFPVHSRSLTPSRTSNNSGSSSSKRPPFTRDSCSPASQQKVFGIDWTPPSPSKKRSVDFAPSYKAHHSPSESEPPLGLMSYKKGADVSSAFPVGKPPLGAVRKVSNKSKSLSLPRAPSAGPTANESSTEAVDYLARFFPEPSPQFPSYIKPYQQHHPQKSPSLENDVGLSQLRSRASSCDSVNSRKRTLAWESGCPQQNVPASPGSLSSLLHLPSPSPWKRNHNIKKSLGLSGRQWEYSVQQKSEPNKNSLAATVTSALKKLPHFGSTSSLPGCTAYSVVPVPREVHVGRLAKHSMSTTNCRKEFGRPSPTPFAPALSEALGKGRGVSFPLYINNNNRFFHASSGPEPKS
ncbi:unnamed protein product [Cyprideis torosa]|uniref:Uncharacterized protein n=1 Tax=Cyprideis torosa TaxID=163714 RepID=A0A7R8W9M2_9CRUS|nr:unnamed protein product [Cyprideis torosa]CAG0884527.1 unnamed protein product [Cyprideis torosa]